MKKIWKFELEADSIRDSQKVINFQAPEGLVPKAIMVQGAGIYLWGEVEIPKTEEKPPRFKPFKMYCIGTGHGSVPEDADYFTSVVHGGYVWHFYLPRTGHAPGKQTEKRGLPDRVRKSGG